MNKIIFLITSLAFVACEPSKKEIESNIVARSTVQINVIKQPIILKDSLTCFKVVLASPNDKILKAYFACGNLKERVLDDKYEGLKTCNGKLAVENDTVMIYAAYGKKGTMKFEDITILVQDKEGHKSFIDTTFYFNVQ